MEAANEFSRCYCTESENIEIAKVVLKRIFSYPEAENGLKVETIYLIGRDSGLVKGVLKKARKELGILSENRDGIQFWYLPKTGDSQ